MCTSQTYSIAFRYFSKFSAATNKISNYKIYCVYDVKRARVGDVRCWDGEKKRGREKESARGRKPNRKRKRGKVRQSTPCQTRPSTDPKQTNPPANEPCASTSRTWQRQQVPITTDWGTAAGLWVLFVGFALLSVALRCFYYVWCLGMHSGCRCSVVCGCVLVLGLPLNQLTKVLQRLSFSLQRSHLCSRSRSPIRPLSRRRAFALALTKTAVWRAQNVNRLWKKLLNALTFNWK